MTTFADVTAGPVVDHRDPIARLSALFDPGTLALTHAVDGTGVVAGMGRTGRLRALAYCTDATRMGGALGRAGCRRIVETIDTAVRMRVPVVGLWHCGGARLAEGVDSLDGVGEMFAAMVRASGRVPQISVMLGPAAGGAAYGSALTDVVVMAPDARVFVTGPDVIRTVTGEVVDQDSLGGPAAHARSSGVTHLETDSETAAYAATRELVDHLARPGTMDPAAASSPVDLQALLPERRRRAYDMRHVVRGLLDDGRFLELQARWAPNVVVGFGRLAGGSVGVVANNPLRLAGCLDSESAEKAARFVRLCDASGVPLVVLEDVPGYLPGVDQEWGGIVRRGAKLLHAFAEATVPRVTVVVRKAFGGAYVAMNSRGLGATAVFAWPDAEVAVMGARAAVEILQRRALLAAAPEDREALLDELVERHERTVGGLDRAVELGAVDDVIDPSTTRQRVAAAIAAAPARRGRHANIPL